MSRQPFTRRSGWTPPEGVAVPAVDPLARPARRATRKRGVGAKGQKLWINVNFKDTAEGLHEAGNVERRLSRALGFGVRHGHLLRAMRRLAPEFVDLWAKEIRQQSLHVPLYRPASHDRAAMLELERFLVRTLRVALREYSGALPAGYDGSEGYEDYDDG